MSKREETIVYNWEETGRLEIDVHGNQFARIRFTPSPAIFENICSQSRKISANNDKKDLQPSTTKETKPRKTQKSASQGHTISEGEEQRDMKESQNVEPFARISRRAMNRIIEKNFAAYSCDLHEMSCIVSAEGRYHDLLKISMMKFHLDLSGLSREPYVDPITVEFAKNAIEQSGMKREDVDELFLSTIKPHMTPTHYFTVPGSLRMFHLALDSAERKIREILRIVSK